MTIIAPALLFLAILAIGLLLLIIIESGMWHK
jgi:hypothetical protein